MELNTNVSGKWIQPTTSDYIITVNNEILPVKNKLWTQLVYTGKESIERWNNWLGEFNTEKQIIENLWKSLISPL